MRLRAECRGRTESALDHTQGLDRQDIISVNLERAIQLCVDIAVHEYEEMDWDRVYQLITRKLIHFQDFGRWVGELLD